MSNASKPKIVIVGGGYLGTMTALMISQAAKFDVTLIEKQNRLCGLYNNAWEQDGNFFDYGSRAILQTGVPSLDDLQFSLLPDDEYPKTTNNLKEFSFQNGKYCGHSNCLDARTLPESVFQSGKAQMLAITDHNKSINAFPNLLELSEATYGSIFTHTLIKPAIEKLTGLSIEQLDSAALSIHGLQRIIVGGADQSKELKDQSDFDGSRIAFAKYDDNKSSMIKTYPLTSGLGDYARRLEAYLKRAPTTNMIMETSVVDLIFDAENIVGLVLEDRSVIDCDHLIWTIPSVFLARLLGKGTTHIEPPKFRNTVLSHYIIDGDITSKAYFVYNYDPSYQCYRGTFYDNFCDTRNNQKRITVEAFHDEPDPDLDRLEKELFAELIAMGCVTANSAINKSHTHFQRGSWPNFASNFFSSQATMNDLVSSGVGNLSLAGKANGKHHSSALVQNAFEIFQDLENEF
jgi:protoporphyrinogen oxidase